jgi:hypothetical protein
MSLSGFGELFDFAGKVVDKLFPNAVDAANAKIELFKLQQTGELARLAAETDLAKGQIEVNKVEAASSSLFVAGWRPAVGWVGAAGFGYSVILEPIARFVAQVGFGYVGLFPVIDTNLTLQILMGLLGLSYFRSQDKKNGVAS